MCKPEDPLPATEATFLLKDSPHHDVEAAPTASSAKDLIAKDDTKQTFAAVSLTTTIWISNTLFGCFALLHYLRAYFSDDIDTQAEWDLTDPHLYKKNAALPNRMMVLHLMGGVFMMFAGPIQFIKAIRRNYMVVHRWTGRLYIVSALAASGFATLFTLIYKTSRCNFHEDLSNYILGGCTFVSAIQCYRYVAISRDIEKHQLWAWRVYASVLGAPFFRLYAGLYFSLLKWTYCEGSLFWENSLFYINTIPNLIAVEIMWERKKQGLPLVPSAIYMYMASVFLVIVTVIPFATWWLPSITGTLYEQLSSAEGGAKYPTDFCPSTY